MEAHWNPPFAEVLHQADLVTPDGKPLVLMLRKLGVFNQNQVAGMDVFLNLCDLAEQTEIKTYFLGSTNDILEKIRCKLDREYPLLKVAGMRAIPFMTLNEILSNRDRALIDEINESGAGIVFVCLGCPKQEIWMSRYQGSIKGVMIGVGAVFSMYAGIKPRAPHWIQQLSLEWLYRLLQEPRRLWHRYGSTIPPFVYLAIRQLFVPSKEKFKRVDSQLCERNMVVDIATLDFSCEQLGEILIRQNVINREELEEALLEQNLHPQLKIGELLVRNRSISLSQLKFYLKNQNIKLGELLIEKKLLNQRSLNRILRSQKNADVRLGEILVKHKAISENQQKELLIEQYTRRKGLFLIESQSNNYNLVDFQVSTSITNDNLAQNTLSSTRTQTKTSISK
ncbi:WecB/TagA/CpsF family glycosyltransferase [Myxosarcina sp. GI1]|uniref:WecB/TagA/CpsF family glycosyltransferase n=1 Tax=Myxosarcina sp. GI1 TaxID=1541065 RepID=UPI0020A0A13B|nr:WecB/TagA/CpsF family glycosyltransferase [Myxosarcina sp. GI1]